MIERAIFGNNQIYVVPTCELCSEQRGPCMKESNMPRCYNEVYYWTLSVKDYSMSAIKR